MEAVHKMETTRPQKMMGFETAKQIMGVRAACPMQIAQPPTDTKLEVLPTLPSSVPDDTGLRHVNQKRLHKQFNEHIMKQLADYTDMQRENGQLDLKILELDMLINDKDMMGQLMKWYVDRQNELTITVAKKR